MNRQNNAVITVLTIFDNGHLDFMYFGRNLRLSYVCIVFLYSYSKAYMVTWLQLIIIVQRTRTYNYSAHSDELIFV